MYLKKHGLADRGLIVGYDARYRVRELRRRRRGSRRRGRASRWRSASELCPTPVVSYSIIDRKAGGGVVITASHNPWQWNGFKYKPEYGGSASPEVVAELEEPLPSLVGRDIPTMDIDEAKSRGTGRDVRLAPAVHRAARAAGRPRPRCGPPASTSASTRCTAPAPATSPNCSAAARRRSPSCTASATPSSPACTRPSRSRATSPTWSRRCATASSTPASRTTATPTASASPTRTASSSTSSRSSACSATTCSKRAASAARS